VSDITSYQCSALAMTTCIWPITT